MTKDFRAKVSSFIVRAQAAMRKKCPAGTGERLAWPLMVAAGCIYYTLNYFKYLIYKKGVIKPRRTGIFTLCVGNIKVGGTGKSPLVIKIATGLLNRGIPVCVINRGYLGPVKSLNVISDGVRLVKKVSESSDEAYMEALALLGGRIPGARNGDSDIRGGDAGRFISLGENHVEPFTGALVMTAKERVDAIDHLEKIGFSGVALLDDAFQYYRLEKDLNIVLLDYSDPFSNFLTFPAGMLRDRPERLSEAGIVVFTKCPRNFSDVNRERLEKIAGACSRFGFAGPKFFSRTRMTGLYNVKNARHCEFSEYRGKRALIVSALADNSGFFSGAGDAARSAGIDAACEGFCDHFAYDDASQKELASKMAALKFDLLITTFKDIIKLKKEFFESVDVCVAAFETEVEGFDAMMESVVAGYERKGSSQTPSAGRASRELPGHST